MTEAKHVFQVHGVDASGRVVVARAIRRNKLLEFFASLPPCVAIGIALDAYDGSPSLREGHDQKVAAAYMASCTPDFFLFGADRQLFYHGQFDDSSPASPLPVTGSDLREATEALLAGQSAPEDQKCVLGVCVAWNDDRAIGACAAE